MTSNYEKKIIMKKMTISLIVTLITFTLFAGNNTTIKVWSDKNYFTSLQEAYDNARDNETLRLKTLLGLIYTLELNRDIEVTLIGGYDDKWNKINNSKSSVIIKGSSGVLILKNIILVSSVEKSNITIDSNKEKENNNFLYSLRFFFTTFARDILAVFFKEDFKINIKSQRLRLIKNRVIFCYIFDFVRDNDLKS